MEKKFDFKTIAIACLLFFGFVFLLFYKFSSADDSINHYKLASEIFSSQQSFDDFKDTLPKAIIPEWYSESESMANLLDTIACFAIGDYLQVADNVVSELSGQITGDPLFLEHFLFDFDSLSWVFDSGTSDFIKSSVDPLIYVEPSTDVIGSWILSNNSLQRGIYRNNDPTSQLSSFRLRNLSWGEIPNDFYITVVGSAEASASSNRVLISSTVPGIIYFYLNGTYQDYVYMQSTYVVDGVTYYYCSVGSNYSTGAANFMSSLGHNTYPKYSNNSVALQDLWGNVHPDEPYLIDGVSIRNDDFIVKPLSYPASVMVDYPNLITYPDYDPDDTRLTFEYTYNMDVPFWLKNPTTEPTSYELSTDYDFGNIEYEYEADPSYLAGAGIVQDVFEILPVSLQGLIALFGAGSLAFIFLRR